MTNSLSDKVIHLVSRHRAVPRERVKLESRLREDLGMEGDDAIEFLEEFSRQFDVDFANFEFNKHFGPEGCNPLSDIFGWVFKKYSKYKDLGSYPITVKHLICVAERRKWFLPERTT